MTRLNFLIFLLGFACTSYIQAQHTPVFPELSGEALADAIRESFRPNIVFSYGEARDTLFSKVLAKNDSLKCLYTDYTIYLDPNQDPTEDAFAKGLNTEHLWPRSKGASHVQAEANMYHIYPTRENVNNDRGNLPFNDIPDAQTNWWYYKAIKQGNIPTTNKDLYSELGQGFFEPAEAVKGDVARAMFYFYTIYRPEVDAADPAFFGPQRATFCQWHFDDPVDPAEWEKNELIAPYQDNKSNPFILDCTAAQRAYCSEFQNECIVSSIKSATSARTLHAKLYPIPFAGDCTLEVDLPLSGNLTVTGIDLLGRVVHIEKWDRLSPGIHKLNVQQDEKTWISGFLYLEFQSTAGNYRQVLKF